MTSIRTGAAALALAALASGCALMGALPPSNTLIGEWAVEDVDNTGVIDGANLTVTFDETSRVSGAAGCNRFTGAYSYDATAATLTITPLGATRMLCAPALMTQERRFIQSLQAATSVESTVDGATVLKSATGRVLLRRRSPPPSSAATKAAKPPASTVATAPPPSSTSPYGTLSGGPTSTFPSAAGPVTPAYTPPYASVPPLETPSTPAAITQVSATGELFFLERIALPPGAQVRIQLRDVSRVGAPAIVLASQEFAAGTGGPYPFSISAPSNVVPANARLTVFAQILAGGRLLFITDTNNPVSATSPNAPMSIRMVSVAASGVSRPPVTTMPVTPPSPPPVTTLPASPPTVLPATSPPSALPSIISGPTGPAPTAYRCGSETLRVAFDASMAWLTTADGVLAVPRVNPSDDPFAQRMYSNNRITFIQDQEGSSGARVQFARGRMALQTCAKVR